MEHWIWIVDRKMWNVDHWMGIADHWMWIVDRWILNQGQRILTAQYRIRNAGQWIHSVHRSWIAPNIPILSNRSVLKLLQAQTIARIDV